MKKALGVVAALALVVWVISWFRAERPVAVAAAQTWPAGLGTLDSVAGRYPPLSGNAPSAKLAVLGGALAKSDQLDGYVAREIARGDLTIGEPPVLPDVSAIRELLLREGIVWKRNGGISGVGNNETAERRGMQMTIARSLIASALMKAGKHDPGAWDDLHAVWNLARSLEPQQEMMAQTAALSMLRMINAIGWKMPLPAPAWFAELQQRDVVPRLLEAFQYQAAAYWKSGAQFFPTKWLADSIERDRRIAEGLFRETRCDVHAPMNDLGTDLSSVWRRAFRYRAEREATANAIRIRTGRTIETISRCSDGRWMSDGATLRFSRDIATARQDWAMPLVLRAGR
ncbi:MAG TPA: hypothetical protein VL284_01105 [Thermoanaerobaculia bacterium]|nr:hypothetical protein [Thermoanaerobaculia bacterium]